MKIHRFEISGVRSLRKTQWHPAALSVIADEAPGTSGADLFATIDLLSAAARDWTALGERIEPTRFWSPGATTAALAVHCRDDDDELDFVYELGLAPCEGGAGWEIELERVSRSSEWDFHEILVREWGNASMHITPKTAQPQRDAPKPVHHRAAVASDMTALSVLSLLRTEPRVARFAEAIADVMLYASFREDASTALRSAPLDARLDPYVSGDGRNFVNALFNLYDFDAPRTHLESTLGAVLDGWTGMRFTANGARLDATATFRSGDHRAVAELPSEALHALRTFTTLLAAQRPMFIGVSHPERGIPEPLIPQLADAALAGSERGQIALVSGSGALLARLSEYVGTVEQIGG